MPNKKNNNLTVLFLSGFMSNMEGGKALFLQKLAEEKGLPFIRFDYSGTGQSSGIIENGSITLWKENARNIIEQLAETEKVILIGSSMGGWIATLLALEMPEKIHSMITIAAAPDFTEKLIWDQFDEAAKAEVMGQGYHNLPTDHCDDGEPGHYPITKLLIEDGRANQLLNRPGKLPINIPVTLIHGTEDIDVPYQYSIDLAEKLASTRTEVILQQGGKHRMSTPADLSLLQEVLEKHIILK